MLKFRAAANLAAASQRLQKKERFAALQENVKQRKKSVQQAPSGKSDLNSKYEEEAAMELQMKLLYNARYEMSDEDLDEMSSGLEDALMEESSNEERSETGSEDEPAKPKKEPKDAENESDDACSLPSDVAEMLAERGNDGGDYDDDDDDSDDSDDSDDDVSVKSDFELDNIIPSDDGGDSEDDDIASQIDNKESDDGVNYSALEEDENEDSDAFTFTGQTETPTGRETRSSIKSNASKTPSNPPAEESQDQPQEAGEAGDSIEESKAEDGDGKEAENEIVVDEQVIESDEESVPDMTYSKSISDIEEYESDVFDLVDEASEKKEHAYSYGAERISNDSDGDFSIPRANETSCEVQADQKDIGNEIDEVNGTMEVHGGNTESVKEEEVPVRGEADDQLGGSNMDQDEFRDNPENEQNCRGSDENKSQGDEDELRCDKEAEETLQNGGMSDMDGNQGVVEGTEKEGKKEQLEPSILSEADVRQERHAYAPVNDLVTYQKARKKGKRMLKKKERMEIFMRKMPGKKKKNQDNLPPDSSIPSYKAKLAEAKAQKRDEIISMFMNEFLGNVHKEAARRKVRREATSAVGGILEDVLDMWEGHVDTRCMIHGEKELENLSTCMVMATMIVAARDVAGEEPYTKMLHKEPVFKKTAGTEKESRERKRVNLQSRKKREELRRRRRKAYRAEKQEGTEEGLTEEKEDDPGEQDKEHAQQEESRVHQGEDEKEESHIQVAEEDLVDYIAGEDCLSIGKSTVATVKRGEGVRQIKDEEEVDEALADVLSIGSKSIPCKDKDGLITKVFPKIKLQKMETNKADEPEYLLKTLPKADKSEYCFQWVMNSTEAPSPPLRGPKPDNNIGTLRKKRFLRRRNRASERPTSTTSIDDSTVKMDAIVYRALKSPGDESGESLAASGRDSRLTVKSGNSIASLEVEQIKVEEESLGKSAEDNIIQYFSGIMTDKMEERNKLVQSQAEAKKDANLEEGEEQNRSKEDDSESDASKSGDTASDVKDDQANENESIKSEESLLPSESTIVDDDSNERFPTPESEPEPEPEPEEEVQVAAPKRTKLPKLKMATTTMIRWRCFKPVITQGASLSDYNTTMMRLRRSRFTDLSLSKPNTLSDLHKPVKIENVKVTRHHKSAPSTGSVTNGSVTNRSDTNRSDGNRSDAKSSPLRLPPIRLQRSLGKPYQSRLKSSSFNSEETICLPDIHANTRRQKVTNGKFRGAWY